MTKTVSALSHIRALNDLRRCAAQSCASEESRLNPQRWDDAIAAAIAALKGEAVPPLGPFAVVVDGGLVQDVVSSDPRLVGVKFVTIDYDIEGLADEDEITAVPQGNGTTQDAYCRRHEVAEAVYDLGAAESWPRQTVSAMLDAKWK